MSMLKSSAAATALLAGLLLGAPGGAQAQLFNRPPAADQGGADQAALVLQIQRLENQIRSLTGQLEEAQFQNRRLEEQVRRLQEASGAGANEPPPGRAATPPQRRSEGFDAPAPAGSPMPLPGASGGARSRGDAFDPSQSPNAPGAPRVLGALERPGLSGPLGDAADEGPYRADPSAPLDLLNARRGQTPAPSAGQGFPPSYPQAAPAMQDAPVSSPRPQTPRTQTAMPVDPAPGASTLPPPGPREQLDASNAALRSGDLQRAEAGYKEFLERYPTSRLAPEATFNLGDVYARRGRHRDAAEQFLKVTTDFSKSAQAPQSLHRLGQSLERLGAKEQACAAWAEVPRKYPSAPQTIRAAAERDIKRASC
jgi:tol-pal system protein YbgF